MTIQNLETGNQYGQYTPDFLQQVAIKPKV